MDTTLYVTALSVKMGKDANFLFLPSIILRWTDDNRLLRPCVARSTFEDSTSCNAWNSTCGISRLHARLPVRTCLTCRSELPVRLWLQHPLRCGFWWLVLPSIKSIHRLPPAPSSFAFSTALHRYRSRAKLKQATAAGNSPKRCLYSWVVSCCVRCIHHFLLFFLSLTSYHT